MNFPNIRIVLIETSHPGNIGAAARAMKNMGLGRLVLVKPRHWPAQEARNMAASASDVLENAVVVETLEAAVADCHLVVGTSARLRNMPVTLLDPSACAATVLALPEEREVALVFGREVSGLTNDELLRCHYHVHIAVNPDYTSLNLAAAVMVLSYELRKTALALTEAEIEHKAAVPQPGQVGWGQQPATADELEHYLNHLEKILIQLDFHKPQHKRPLMQRLRRLYQRVQLESMEVNILRGILTATEQALAKGSFPLPAPDKPVDHNS